MRISTVPVLLVAGLAGVAIGACNFLVPGYDGYGATGGGTTTSSPTGGSDGGTGGDAGDAGMKRGVWSSSLGAAAADAGGKTSVRSIAVGPDGHVFLTGAGIGPSNLQCTSTQTLDTGAAYVLELDSNGDCQWSFFFGDGNAEGTGVAVDSGGNVALTGTFDSQLTIRNMNPWLAHGKDSFVALFGPASSSHALRWTALIGEGGAQGDQVTTGVALTGGTLAVSGYYTGSLGVSYLSGGPGMKNITGSADATDAFAILFDPSAQTVSGEVGITSPSGKGVNQFANSVSLDTSDNVAVTGTAWGPTQFDLQPPFMASASGNVYLALGTSLGQVPFATLFGGDSVQEGRSVAFDHDRGVFVGATFMTAISALGLKNMDAGLPGSAQGGTAVFVARYDAQGDALAGVSFGSDTLDENATLAGVVPFFDGDAGTATLAGSFQGTAHFSDGTHVATTSGKSAVYVAKVDETLGKLLWVGQYGDGVKDQVVDAIAVDPQGSVLLAGHFQGTLDFGGKGSPLTNDTTTPQVFVAKLMK